jgi:oligopeptide transport system substrate-binding protein
LNPLIHQAKKKIGFYHSCFKFLVVIVFLSGIACQQSIAKKEGFLYLQLNTNPTTLDPALIVDVTGASIGAKLFNGLVRFDQDLHLRPDIAEKWEISPDGKTYIFFLHRGIHFSNGREVTADDIKYSFERVLNPATRSPRTWVFDRIEGAQEFMKNHAPELSGIKVKDAHTLMIHLTKPFGPFLSLLSLTTASVVPKEEVEKWGADFSSHVVGTGPFMLQQWQHSQHLCLVVNPKFFRSPPHIKGMVYRIIPEDLTTIVEFEIGNLDIIRIPAPEFHKYYTHPGKYSIKEQPGLNIYYVGLNCQQPPLNDIRIRQAICMAIDREKIRTTLFEKRGLLALSPVPPLLRKSFPPLKDYFPYNPARACELIKKAGYPKGFPLTITITALPEVLDIVEVIQQYLQEVGIKVSIVQLEWSSFKEVVAQGKAQAFWLSWWADYPDAENFLFPLFHSSNWGAGGNRSFYKNRTVDLLIGEAQQQPDETTRIRLFHEAEKTIIQEAPIVSFWHQTDYYLVQPWVNNFIPSPLSTSEDGTDISLSLGTSKRQH